MYQLSLGQFESGDPMFNWYQCNQCNHKWIGKNKCPKCGNIDMNTGWIAGKDGESFDQKNADRMCLNPFHFKKKYTSSTS